MTSVYTIGDYTIHELIANGSFGSVRRGTHNTTGIPVAIKFIPLKDKKSGMHHIRKEIAILKMIDHPNIVKYMNHFNCSFLNISSTCLVMPFYSNSTLQSVMANRNKIISVEQRQIWMVQLLHAITHMHQMGVIHGDLHMMNLFVSDDDNLVVGDLGNARQNG